MMNKTLLCFAIAAFSVVRIYSEDLCSAECLLATSNQWGTTVREHRSSIYSAIAGVVTNENGEACLRQWYERMSSYPTADISTPSGRLWKVEQSMLLMMFGDTKAIASSTNCWFAVADCMGRLRCLERPGLESEIAQFCQNNVTNENQEAYLQQMSAYDCLREEQRILNVMESNVLRAVTNSFPNQIFPSLLAQHCHELNSNVLSRAQLKVDEMAVLEDLAGRIGQSLE